MNVAGAIDAVREIIALGGPVVGLLLFMSVAALAVIIWKFAAFFRARVGQHKRLRQALDAWDRGDRVAAMSAARASRSHLAPVMEDALAHLNDSADAARFQERVETAAVLRLGHLERGFRLLDSIAQIAPLLGLFGTVLGMIGAFQALQDAGANVDPSVLAGGIWVALLTTAVGLGVAMPVSIALTWFESRVERDRAFAERMVARLFCPTPDQSADPTCEDDVVFGYAASS